MTKMSGFLRIVKQTILGSDGPLGEVVAQRETEIYGYKVIVILAERKQGSRCNWKSTISLLP
jgi:hypothetical protein